MKATITWRPSASQWRPPEFAKPKPVHRRELLATLSKYENALKEIAAGKSDKDRGYPPDEWLLMAGRLVGIAQKALEKKR